MIRKIQRLSIFFLLLTSFQLLGQGYLVQKNDPRITIKPTASIRAFSFDLKEVREILEKAPGVIVQDDVKNNVYPMPIHSHGKDEVFVGRLRRDESQPNTLNMWVVSDNLRKGAATNAVQIAEFLMEKSLVVS